MNDNTLAKPFLRWAGSKKKILPELSKYWNTKFDSYIEPFVGSAQLFCFLKPKNAIISDINTQLIITYKKIQENPLMVFLELSKLKVGKEEYYNIRALDPKTLNEWEITARLIYLNRYCFNGLYRTNLKGQFNVPYAGLGNRTGQLPSLEHLQIFSDNLKNTEIINSDFQEVILKKIKPNSFVYLDPPYAIANKRIFNQYNPSSFGLNDIDRLEETLNFIHDNNSKFLLSYAYDESIIEKFSKWNYEEISINRNIAGFSKNRRRAKELLITNVNISY